MTRRAAAATYPIRAVARMTGLSVDTLRAWERRYGAVAPKRGQRGRVYSESDVARLKQLAQLVVRGHAIGTVAGLENAALARLIERADAFAAAPADSVVADLAPLVEALDRYDLPAIERTLARHAVVLPTRELVFAVVLPLLRDLGERWETGALSPAQEHLISAIVRSVLGGLLRAIGHDAAYRASRPIVFATPAGERHELCLLCAAVLAADAGRRPLYLGADLPAADIAHAAATADADIVVLAATTRGVVTRREARRLNDALSGVDVWIGGPQAASLQADVPRAKRIDRLEDVAPLLSQMGRSPGVARS